MNGQAKKNIFLVSTVFLAVVLFYIPKVDARSGCCSSHGGVCGCGCCDGSGLSATCAPYYPECNSAPTYTAPTKPATIPQKPTTSPTYTAPSNSSSSVTPISQLSTVASSSNSSSSKDDNSFVIGIAMGALGAGAIGWYINKKNKK